MKKKLVLSLGAAYLFLSIIATLNADDIVFNDGVIDWVNGGYAIDGGYSVTNSFTVSANTSLTSSEFAMLVNQGDTPSSVDWSIGTSKFARDVSAGTAVPLTNTFDHNAGGVYDAYYSRFSIHGDLLANTTYWLTLSNS
jgi:hypothetical protein